MPLEGRGSSTCLICDQPGTLVQVFPKLIKEIRRLFKSREQYHNMLSASKMCLTCIGRFFQLFEFEMIRDSDCVKEAFGTLMCYLCCSNDIMPEHVLGHAFETLKQTRFWEDYHESIQCCYACYTSVKLYARLKATLDEQRLMFLARINKCHVEINRVPDDDSDAESVIIFPPDSTENNPQTSDEAPTQPKLNEETKTQTISSEEPQTPTILKEETPAHALSIDEPQAHAISIDESPAEQVLNDESREQPVQSQDTPARPLPDDVIQAQAARSQESLEIPVVTVSAAENIPSATEVMPIEQEALPAELEVSSSPPESIQTIPDDAIAEPEIPITPSAKQSKPESASVHSSSAEAEQARPATKRARRNGILERLGSPDVEQEQIKSVDKFTDIKNRRGANRSNDLKELPKKRKSLGNIKMSEEAPKKKRRHSADLKSVATHRDAGMNVVECQPEELKNESKVIEEPPIETMELDKILEIIGDPAAVPRPTPDNTPDENQIVSVEPQNKEENKKRMKLQTKYQNLRDKLHKAKGGKTKTERRHENLKYGTDAIAYEASFRLKKKCGRKAGSKKQKKNLKKSRKSDAAQGAPSTVQEIQSNEEVPAHEDIESNEVTGNDAIVPEVAESTSEINSSTSRSGSEIMEVTTSDADSSFRADQARFDAEHSSDYALFPALQGFVPTEIIDDAFNFGAEVVISEQAPEEPVIPLEGADRPTDEEVIRFKLKMCSVVLERLPPQESQRSPNMNEYQRSPSANEFRRLPSVKATERFTMSGRKCLVAESLIDDTNDLDEDFEETLVKPKKVAKKGFKVRLVPSDKPTKKEKLRSKNFLCYICYKSFAAKHVLKTHLEAVHLKEKRFACDVCGITFYLKSQLVGHMRRHIEGKPVKDAKDSVYNSNRLYPCNFEHCKKFYKTKQSLREHTKTHSDDRQHECYCGKAFKLPGQLKKHKKIHS